MTRFNPVHPAKVALPILPLSRLRIKPLSMENLWLTPSKEALNLRATGIVRRIDELGRVVIPKEIRRTLRIREGDPYLTTLTRTEKFCMALLDAADRLGAG